MATLNFIPESRQVISAMEGVIDYCLQESKIVDDAAGQRMVSGISCDGENAFVEFMTTKQAYRNAESALKHRKMVRRWVLCLAWRRG